MRGDVDGADGADDDADGKKKGKQGSKIDTDEMLPDDLMMSSYKTEKEGTEMMGWRKRQNQKRRLAQIKRKEVDWASVASY